MEISGTPNQLSVLYREADKDSKSSELGKWG